MNTRVRKNPFDAESESKRPAVETPPPDSLAIARILADFPDPEPAPEPRTIAFEQACDPRYGIPSASLVSGEHDPIWGEFRRELEDSGLTLLRLWMVTNPWADRRYYDCLARDEHFGVGGIGVRELWHLPGNVSGVGARGLTTKLANPNGCFGTGIYASTPAKAAEYRTKQKEPLSREEGDPPDVFTLAVVELNLGKMAELPKNVIRRRTYCAPSGYDSVRATISGRHEWVVWEDERARVGYFADVARVSV
jgi:hypothetical protein